MESCSDPQEIVAVAVSVASNIVVTIEQLAPSGAALSQVPPILVQQPSLSFIVELSQQNSPPLPVQAIAQHCD